MMVVVMTLFFDVRDCIYLVTILSLSLKIRSVSMDAV